MRRRRADEPPRRVEVRLRLPALLTTESFIDQRLALRTLRDDAIRTARACDRALRELVAAAEERGLKVRGRPLEGLTSRDDAM